MLRHIHTYAPVLPVLVMALVIVIAAVSLKHSKVLRARQDSNLRPTD